jgi:GntR family transcriptional repressor for pyruvate dehydrogenase complex
LVQSKVSSKGTRAASASVLALEQLVEMITSGEVGPGDRLPTERNLTTRLGLSRSTVREAIRSLELLGVVDSRQGDGTYVRKLDASLVL